MVLQALGRPFSVPDNMSHLTFCLYAQHLASLVLSKRILKNIKDYVHRLVNNPAE